MKTIRTVEIPFVTPTKLYFLLFLSQSQHHNIYYKTFIFSNSSVAQSHLSKEYSILVRLIVKAGETHGNFYKYITIVEIWCSNRMVLILDIDL